MPAEESAVEIDGPWTHRYVNANGNRFHLAEAGSGPLVLLLHGFPEFWWAWRHQLTGLADAGYRAVAVDLRGYGASDKPPRGYDPFTLAADVAGMVRALGEHDAVIVGHDWGGLLAWTVATFHPRVVRRLAVLSMPHPIRLRTMLAADREQRRAGRQILAAQAPGHAEDALVEDDGAAVARLLSERAGPTWRGRADYPAAVRTYRETMLIPGVAHCAVEYDRWLGRSLIRPSGWRYFRLMAEPVMVPTLHLHGAADRYLLPRSAQGSGRYVAAAYEWRTLIAAAHFPHEESPERVTGELVRWAKGE
jgi:pimeloyl-ACP methyl ester carboxylesterase